MARRRRRLSRKRSRKMFRRSSGMTNKKNIRSKPMRGGIRL